MTGHKTSQIQQVEAILRSVDKIFMNKSLQVEFEKPKRHIINNYATSLTGFMDAISGVTKGRNILIFHLAEPADGGRGGISDRGGPLEYKSIHAAQNFRQRGPMATELFQFDRG